MKQVTFEGFELHKKSDLKNCLYEVIEHASKLPLEEKVEFLNEVRALLHEISPFKNHPVDYVKWVKAETVQANDYNPNRVALQEMDLLRTSIRNSGVTQPCVTSPDVEINLNIIVDGFHRNIVEREIEELHGYLPITELTGKTRYERQAATIEHNRARGKHEVVSMGEIVKDMIDQGVQDPEISENLGMSEEELTRLKQITGIAARFANKEYSKAWGELDDKLEIR